MLRSKSMRAGGAELLRSASLAHVAAHQPRFGAVALGRRLRHWLDATPAGLVLDLVSSTLSLLIICAYIGSTYMDKASEQYMQLHRLELACCCWFAAEWLLHLWTANDKIRYVVSLPSFIDLITVVPLFITDILGTAISSGSRDAVLLLSLVRFLRVLRVFRIFQLGTRITNEVHSCLLALACTLVALILISGAVFYEIETNYGNKYPGLRYHEALYWSVVTATTIGYGDFSPSLPGSQMALLGILLVTFILLPYQSSNLVNALGHSSGYQRAAYSTAKHGRHLLLIGELHSERLHVLLEQLFHADYGFQDHQVVLLHPQPPEEAIRKLLKTHDHNHRLFYIQGDPFDQLALERAQAAEAEAIFLLTPHVSSQPAAEDLRATLLLQHLGHTIQRHQARLASSATSRPWTFQLTVAMGRLLRWLQPGKQFTGIPKVYLQLMLPESQQRVHLLLAAMVARSHEEEAAAAGPLAEGREAGVCPAIMPGIDEERHSWASGSFPSDGTTGAADSSPGAASGASAWGYHDDGQQHCQVTGGNNGTPGHAPQPDSTNSRLHRMQSRLLELTGVRWLHMRRQAATRSAPGVPTQVSSCHRFWAKFSSGVVLLSGLEVQAVLLGLAAVGGPAVVPLLSNLVRSVDSGGLTEDEFKRLPTSLQEYLEGSAMELYEVATFPPHLVGRPFTQVARYLLDVHHALLLALAPPVPAGDLGAGCLMAPVQQHLMRGCRGYIIASDLRVALDIAEAQPDIWAHWLAEWGQEDAAQADILLCDRTKSGASSKHHSFVVAADSGRLVKAQATLDAGDGACSPQPPAEEELAAELWRHGSGISSPEAAAVSGRQSSAGRLHYSSTSAGGAPHSSHEQPSLARRSMRYTAPAVPRANSRARLVVPDSAGASWATPSPGAHGHAGHGQQVETQQPSSEALPGSCVTRQASTDVSAAHSPPVVAPDTWTAAAAAAGGVSTSGPAHMDSTHSNPTAGSGSVLSSLATQTGRVLFSPLLAAAAAASTAGGGNKRHRSSFMYHGGQHSFHSDWEGSTTGLLLEEAGSPQALDTGLPWAPTNVQQLQQLYHTLTLQDKGQHQVQQLQSCTQQGHLVVVPGAGPLCAGMVFALLAPLRSRTLPNIQPVVILSPELPDGPEWAAVARLQDVWFVQGDARHPRDLARVNLRAAALAVVLPATLAQPASSQQEVAEQQRMLDMQVTATVQLLRVAAPKLSVTASMCSPASSLWLDPAGWLLDWQAAGAAAQVLPAAMSGAALLPQMVDCCLCQTHSNGFTWPLLQQLMLRWHSHASAPDQAHAGSESHGSAASGVTSGGVGVLLQVAVPWPGPQHYGDLFTLLLRECGWLPLALYRLAQHRGRLLPYVYTNPGADTLLRRGDQVVMLVPHHPGSGGLPADVLRHLWQRTTSSSTGHPHADAATPAPHPSPAEAAAASPVAAQGEVRWRWQSAARRVLARHDTGPTKGSKSALV